MIVDFQHHFTPRELFKEDPKRFDKFHLRMGDLLFDYSKNRVTDETMRLLYELAEQAKESMPSTSRRAPISSSSGGAFSRSGTPARSRMLPMRRLISSSVDPFWRLTARSSTV
jgi:hypothetical protein